MKLLHSSIDLSIIGHLQTVLANEGIECWIKNQNLTGGIGELPPNECWPQLWIHNDADYSRAMEIVSPIISPTAPGKSSWKCACGETLEGQFDSCWQCGSNRPD